DGIVANPLAEDRWLVLAGWLEEHDDTRRAELFRLHRSPGGRDLTTSTREPENAEQTCSGPSGRSLRMPNDNVVPSSSRVREQEYDGPWKGALEIGFDLFLGLFLEDLYEIADWTKDHVAMDQELQQLTPASATGVRRVDKLFKVSRKGTGDPRFFHVEAQAQP